MEEIWYLQFNALGCILWRRASGPCMVVGECMGKRGEGAWEGDESGISIPRGGEGFHIAINDSRCQLSLDCLVVGFSYSWVQTGGLLNLRPPDRAARKKNVSLCN